MKHLLSSDELDLVQVEKILSLAHEIESQPKKFAGILDGKVVATMFFEPSTRTRLSFESAIVRLGASLISTENANTSSSALKSESLEDTIRTLSGYADAVVMRHGEDNSAHRAARVSGECVIINGGSGSAHHPTQSLLDIYTIQKQRGYLSNLKLCVLGDLKFGRTANSLIKLMSLYEGLEVFAFNVEGMGLTEDVMAFMKKKSIPFKQCASFDEIPKDVDVLYQTRFQRERAGGKTEAINLPCISKEILNEFSSNTIVLHPLPRVDEISTDVDNDPRALYFEQAKNGVPIRMAVLVLTLFRLNVV